MPAELIQPQPFLGRFTLAGRFAAKWLGYLDKFLIFPGQLRRRLGTGIDLVHICDHFNAMYCAHVRKQPAVVTCHDLLAVRGALGEETDCPASATGKYLQRWIVAGLRKATAVVCASPATLRDAQRIVRQEAGRPELLLIHHGINYPYRRQDVDHARTFLSRIEGLDLARPFVLHVGSNLRMKNREGVLRIFALTKENWNGQMVFAGQRLSPELRSLGKELGVLDRVVQVGGPGERIARGALQFRPGAGLSVAL